MAGNKCLENTRKRVWEEQWREEKQIQKKNNQRLGQLLTQSCFCFVFWLNCFTNTDIIINVDIRPQWGYDG